jgi:hypothetical protein
MADKTARHNNLSLKKRVKYWIFRDGSQVFEPLSLTCFVHSEMRGITADDTPEVAMLGKHGACDGHDTQRDIVHEKVTLFAYPFELSMQFSHCGCFGPILAGQSLCLMSFSSSDSEQYAAKTRQETLL